MASSTRCIFCKIILGEIPAFKLIETEKSLAFLDIQPLSKGHALIIPKEHAEKMHELSNTSLIDLLPLTKRLADAMNLENYNLLQNNGRLAHQAVDHVHFHLIPKPNSTEGLHLGFEAAKVIEQDTLQRIAEQIKEKLNQKTNMN
ncbi:hypothetical protein PCANB_002281 [Pneumocystis canis]|nr:hypothetical protein PCK1_002252 [Pneumocystis canis]KAG5438951.1 hypothetical protein PCANB_002281 [Pneumocystis canis]